MKAFYSKYKIFLRYTGIKNSTPIDDHRSVNYKTHT